MVDDEDFIRDLYKDIFESQGITVFSAQSGEEALEIFKTLKHKPDAVIMDYRMPGRDGIETTRELLRLDPNIPIIFSSADESVRDKALEAGAISFWSKPFPVGMLVNAMMDILDAKKRSSV
ncbi:MAG TPA: response regulator [Thermoplasmata archaeon]